MAFLKGLYRLLTMPLPSEANLKRRTERRIARKSAARFSRGNIAIQNNAFLTTEELEEERANIARLKLPH